MKQGVVSQPVTKPAIRRKTGICEKTGFLTGSDYAFDVTKGWLPVPLPYKFEYEKMTVPQIASRIKEDLEELVARAYSARQRLTDDTEQMLTWRRPSLSKQQIKVQVVKTVEWIQTVAEPPPKEAAEDEKRAAKSLAFFIQHGATWLEYLFIRRNALMREVAEKNDLWPVNLGMKLKKVKGRVRNELTRVEFARDYLTELGLNTKCNWPSHVCTGAEQKSPFWFAARELYTTLLQIKCNPEFYSVRATQWKKNLLALKDPMTKCNSSQWWKVAKVFLDEEWEINRQFFEPLIKHLKIKPGYDSEIKTRVIDQSLKDAFFALACASDS